MREGLRSSSKSLVKADQVETPAKTEGGSTDEKDCCLTVDKVPKVTAECSNDRRKRSRIDGKGESEDDNSVKRQNFGEDNVVDGELQVARRVLRSVTAAQSEGKENNEKAQSSGGFVAERTRGKTGSEEKRVEVESGESNHVEDSSQLDYMVNTKLERKRGRPPKSSEGDEFQKKLGGSENGQMDQSAGRERHQLNEELHRKRGRPPKSLASDEFQNKEVGAIKGDIESHSQEMHQPSNKMSEELKRKRGRPPKSHENDEFQNKWVDMGKGEIGQSAVQERYRSNIVTRKKLKRKRGRPRKAQQSNGSDKECGGMDKEGTDLSTSQESHQPENEGINKLKPKRGRPPKALIVKQRAEVKEEACDRPTGEESDQLDNEAREKLKHNIGRHLKLNKVKKVGTRRKKKRGRPSKHDVLDLNYNVGEKTSLSGQKLSGKKCKIKLRKAKKIKDSIGNEIIGDSKQKTGEVAHSRSERQAVRDKIVALLLGAGWGIEYRPRHGREYMDAVYVNPEGRTHWSITLAYARLKEQYEKGGGDSETDNSGFKFTPIPDEEINILTKVMVKERSDKNKKKKKWNQGEKSEETTGAALDKRKLCALTGVGHKMSKGRKKLKTIHSKLDNSAATSGEKSMVSAKGCMRLETHGRKRCSLKARNSQDGIASEKDGYMLYNGKRTVLAWMIGMGTVPLDGKVQYQKSRKTRAVAKGSIKTDGIQCDCCSKSFTTTEFEAHAGGNSCQPLKNIYLETGSSLLQCQLDSWQKEDESAHKGFHFIDIDGEDPNDDTCGICGDGGNLICCDSCPSTFHQSCLQIRKFPSGIWHCMYCLCKFCRLVGGNTCQEDDSETAISNFLSRCHLCEDKYHQSCVQENDIINADPGNPSFCGKKCQELYERLEMLLGVKIELDGGFSWSFVRRCEVGSDISLGGMSRKVDCNSKVAVALQIMDECFLPMVDHKSGANLIRNIVYSFGSNFNRLNYCGFFTAILERGDEMTAAASIRIHGNRLAEMPFIGTRYMYRRQGMCRRLLSAIEMALCSLNVEKLVIPAISELTETWTSVFGFKPLERSDKQMLRNMNMIVFPGVDMLQKPLLKHRFTEGDVHPIEGLNPAEIEEPHPMEEKTNKIGKRCSAGFDLNHPSGTDLSPSGNLTNGHAAVESASVPGSSNNLSDIATLNASCKKPVGQSSFTSKTDVRNGILSPVDSFDYAHEQTGDETLNSSDKRFSGEFDLKASVETGVPHASSRIGETVADGSGAQHPDKCFIDTTDITAQDVIDKKCHDPGLVSKTVEQDCDFLVHDAAAIYRSHFQNLVSEYQNATLCEPKTINISHSKVQSALLEGRQRSQDSLNGCLASLLIEHCSSSTGKDAHCMLSEVASGSCSVSMASVNDLKDVSNTSQNGNISCGAGLVSDRLPNNIKLSDSPGSDAKAEANVTHNNSELICNSSAAPSVSLHCASGGGNAYGSSEVVILSNQAN